MGPSIELLAKSRRLASDVAVSSLDVYSCRLGRTLTPFHSYLLSSPPLLLFGISSLEAGTTDPELGAQNTYIAPWEMRATLEVL